MQELPFTHIWVGLDRLQSLIIKRSSIALEAGKVVCLLNTHGVAASTSEIVRVNLGNPFCVCLEVRLNVWLQPDNVLAWQDVVGSCREGGGNARAGSEKSEGEDVREHCEGRL